VTLPHTWAGRQEQGSLEQGRSGVILHTAIALACCSSNNACRDNLHNAKLITTYPKKLGLSGDLKNAAQMWQTLVGPQPALLCEFNGRSPAGCGWSYLRLQQLSKAHGSTDNSGDCSKQLDEDDQETCHLAAGAIDYIS